ncbi:hypothetical protein dsx2_1496 [Desulfovibrio sp. X2]|uniref:ABC transporter substrate-binding protein n=1 Tax=Desulfovibrio sp. X2 TaxID=941449 RepID=UPI0003587B90|nr:ABC transporter substrate-binding protein [Desulfovibrio sp. X2]EPR44537.1 hypothetical protein dsx2_1496 [Desulfovibrio sp. X2]
MERQTGRGSAEASRGQGRKGRRTVSAVIFSGGLGGPCCRLFFCLFCCLAGCLLWAALPCVAAQAQSGRLVPVTFIPQWEPQAQFAGYYCALRQGFYRDRGLDVTILRGGPSRPPSELLNRGEADFGTMFLARALIISDKERDTGRSLVNLAQIVRRGSLLLVAKKSQGIERPEDLEGKRVSMWNEEFRIQPHLFFAAHHVKVKDVPQGFTVDLFLRGGVAACSAMRYNEYHAILDAGYDPDQLTVFDMASAGLDFPEDGIYCLKSTWEKRPEVCRAFVRASIEGWLWAFAHPREALDIVMSYVNAANLPTNRVHQEWMFDHLRQVILPEGAGQTGAGQTGAGQTVENRKGPGGQGGQEGVGILDEQAYDAVVQALEQGGLIHTAPQYGEFHADCR